MVGGVFKKESESVDYFILQDLVSFIYGLTQLVISVFTMRIRFTAIPVALYVAVQGAIMVGATMVPDEKFLHSNVNTLGDVFFQSPIIIITTISIGLAQYSIEQMFEIMVSERSYEIEFRELCNFIINYPRNLQIKNLQYEDIKLRFPMLQEHPKFDYQFFHKVHKALFSKVDMDIFLKKSIH
jgi:hypothetical protein